MSHSYIGMRCTGAFLEIRIVKTPVMGQARTNQHYIARFKPADIIANELGAFAFFKMDQFNLYMVMPPVIYIGNQVLADTEGMAWFFRNFEELWSHSAIYASK
jgi:hypothetical protein